MVDDERLACHTMDLKCRNVSMSMVYGMVIADKVLPLPLVSGIMSA